MKISYNGLELTIFIKDGFMCGVDTQNTLYANSDCLTAIMESLGGSNASI